MILNPSTSQRIGSLVSATHQLWSSPRRTMHQSRVEIALGMERERQVNFRAACEGRLKKQAQKTPVFAGKKVEGFRAENALSTRFRMLAILAISQAEFHRPVTWGN